MKLTKALIEKAQYEGKETKPGIWSRYVIWDELLPGFGVRIFPAESSRVPVKSFILNYRVHGRMRLMSIGRFGVLTLDEARNAARELLVQVSKQVDPLAEREQARRANTFGELWSDFLENYAKIKKRSWLEDERRFKRCIPEAWLTRKVDSINHKDIEDLHRRLGEKSKTEANRTLALLSKMFNYGRLENQTKGIQKFEENQRDRWLSSDEILALRDAITKSPNPYIRAAIVLYLLTGVRKSELLTAKWSDVDFENNVLILRKTKNGKPHLVHLSSLAISILKSLDRVHGNPYILPGGKEGHHLVNIYKFWYQILAEAGLQDVRVHDLRRSFASMIVQNGQSLQLVSKLLNHSNTRMTEVYAKLADSQARDAIEEQGRALQEIIGDIEI